ncbi:response regulator transcription factor [Enterococcus sp. BWB1-3]|uniref:winged helix-turn-helix domain-containing protein n=1 Tax=unclassified Enterococcus TaxID=2608891 RepID=UPI00192204BA|nr:MULTISPECIES: winged helix-turn-helix domain-containing protein [unclassified Enterococcus]MBL1230307.1 response regulator transcription factor [Enterococcus sp. BWB1-3]MCB5951348.1 winged helix-turn-helix domain-containing protein [Enterococcus sp. BWT-B8]
MTTIGIMSETYETNSKYIEKLEEQNFQIIYLNESNYKKYMNSLGIVLMEEKGYDTIGKVCEWIVTFRDFSTAMIYVMSNQESDIGKMIYMQLGINAYVDKNCSVEEFSLMIKNALQRRDCCIKSLQNNHEKQAKMIELYPQNFSISIENGEEITLTRLEFAAVNLLKSKSGTTLTYDEIYRQIWGEEDGNKKYKVTNLFFHLRKKIERDVKNPQYIKTVRSKGYRLDEWALAK